MFHNEQHGGRPHCGHRQHHPEGHGPHGHHGQREGDGHPGPGGHRGSGGRGARFGGPGGRVRRGEARFVLLDVLRDGPKHGYEIIKTLQERSGGQYAPSPGMVYPTLQYLEDAGLVRAEQDAERRVYHLTDAGLAELDAHREEVDAFRAQWAEADVPPASQSEMGFLREEMQHLAQTLWQSVRDPRIRNDHAAIRRMRQAVEGCRNEVRRLLTEADSDNASH